MFISTSPRAVRPVRDHSTASSALLSLGSTSVLSISSLMSLSTRDVSPPSPLICPLQPLSMPNCHVPCLDAPRRSVSVLLMWCWGHSVRQFPDKSYAAPMGTVTNLSVGGEKIQKRDITSSILLSAVDTAEIT